MFQLMKNNSCVSCVLFVVAYVLLIGCSVDDMSVEVPKDISKRPFFTSFYIDKDVNGLKEDIFLQINDSIITGCCREKEKSDSIIPTFEGNFVEVKGKQSIFTV